MHKVLIVYDIDQMSQIYHDSADLLYFLQSHSCFTHAMGEELTKHAFNPRPIALTMTLFHWLGKSNVDIHVCTGKGGMTPHMRPSYKHIHTHPVIHTQNSDITQSSQFHFDGSLTYDQAADRILPHCRSILAPSVSRMLYVSRALQSLLDLDYTPSTVMLNGAKDIPHMCQNSSFGAEYNPDTAWLLDDCTYQSNGKTGPICPYTLQTPVYSHLPPAQHKLITDFLQQPQFYPEGKYSFNCYVDNVTKNVQVRDITTRKYREVEEIGWSRWTPQCLKNIFDGIKSYSIIKPNPLNKYTGTVEAPLETPEMAASLDNAWALVAAQLFDNIQLMYLDDVLDAEWEVKRQELLLHTGFVKSPPSVGDKRKSSEL